MLKQKITCLYPILISLAAGCASHKIEPGKTDFRTKITDTGLKHFEVSIKRQKPRAKYLDPAVRQKQERSTKPRRLQKQLRSVADMYITENGFCKTGYWVVDSNTYAPQISLRGECNEQATDNDRKNFPDTITRW